MLLTQDSWLPNSCHMVSLFNVPSGRRMKEHCTTVQLLYIVGNNRHVSDEQKVITLQILILLLVLILDDLVKTHRFPLKLSSLTEGESNTDENLLKRCLSPEALEKITIPTIKLIIHAHEPQLLTHSCQGTNSVSLKDVEILFPRMIAEYFTPKEQQGSIGQRFCLTRRVLSVRQVKGAARMRRKERSTILASILSHPELVEGGPSYILYICQIYTCVHIFILHGQLKFIHNYIVHNAAEK